MAKSPKYRPSESALISGQLVAADELDRREPSDVARRLAAIAPCSAGRHFYPVCPSYVCAADHEVEIAA